MQPAPVAAARSIAALAALATLAGCYALRSSAGGAQISAQTGEREYRTADIALPAGYRIELVATELNFPTGVCIEPDGRVCVVESGYAYGEIWTTPRLLRISADGRHEELARGDRNGPWTGVDCDGGSFFVAEGGALEGGRILRFDGDGSRHVLVADLPSFGDHHTNGPAVHDGHVYFGQGSATNSGVVGADNAEFGWLERKPNFHDVPGRALDLRGVSYETDAARDRTGAFAPLGERDAKHVEARLPCTSAVMRVPIGGGALELVAWGFRNPFGLAFAPDGQLYVTDNGYDDRGSRPVWGAADLLWRVEAGRWYGWPDYSGDRPLRAREFRPPGKDRVEMLLANPPPRPPKPVAWLDVHCSANGLDVSRSEAFGHVGQAFIALFGDQAPTTGKLLAPVGFKVVRVDLATGFVEDFAANRGKKNGPASRNGDAGLERPIAVRFDRSGTALYIVDFGVLRQDRDGAHPRQGTGALWRVTRVGAAR